MTGAYSCAVLLAFAAMCFGLALLGWVTDKLRVAARWRLWRITKGGNQMNDCRHRAECLKWVPACICNSCAYDSDEERPLCCTQHNFEGMNCPMTDCTDYEKESAYREATR